MKHRNAPKLPIKAASPEVEPGSQMLIEERRQYILALARQNGRVIVEDLSKDLGISRITIRKDLDYLQAKGVLQRTHGGALLPQSGALFDPSLKEKETQHSQEKQRIADAAVALVKEGQCVLLDSGTTTTAIAKGLKKFSYLTIITNAVNIAAELSGTDFEVILTGGSLRRNSFSLVGPLAEEVLAEMHADILFLGVDGFDLEIGLTTPNVMESRVNRAMVKASTTTVAVCDSTKFNRRSLSKIVDVAAIHHVITDTDLPKAMAEGIRDLGLKLTLV
ncbi:transcriptional repressor AgaR [Tunturibacter empetritectus]|uniref:DeoR family transcriptional regulator of aga operon n=1 Tax=Tunturiibacter empetritectus TaxID=3069691 RepID=A0A7W8IHQ4_9BACT|nr:transcriptional repressor AgaR [Edaphobacter lichenicola]MBB5317375.1 DeoR family transcriptional regulator of aga operon [Edaphobacter lichenicola]